ncbi:hypothetical protein BD410DRAFT_792663 [Rickenella mellea]|uniref:Ubiquitin-like domain-containing protein n=1 Tax=Rickenella mellea TaxID=50990 RepID=A0A4Y7PV29_9AGAM|nr:hypothetical protein BD410DRAFT_792663 [Rickenella mellea]
MPKVTTRSQSKASHSTPSKRAFLILQTKERKILIPRPNSYEDAISAVNRHFPAIAKNAAVLQTDALDICESEKVDVTPECWADLMTSEVNSLWVENRDPPAAPLVPKTYQSQTVGSATINAVKVGDPPDTPVPLVPEKHESQSDCTESTDTPEKDRITISVCYGYSTYRFNIRRSAALWRFMQAFAKTCERDVDTLRFCHGGNRLVSRTKADEFGICEGDTIDVFDAQVGKKPIIYLSSPKTITADVTLAVVPEWSLSVVHPAVPINHYSGSNAPKPSSAQKIQWRVTTRPDGTLLEHNTGMEVAYLFWEAQTNPNIPRSPPLSPTSEHPTGEYFCPVQSDLYDTDSVTVVLPIASVAQYLDRALKVLGLHVEARTSFVTYWLPSLLKHKFVAVRFVPQTAYESSPVDHRTASRRCNSSLHVVQRHFPQRFKELDKSHCKS